MSGYKSRKNPFRKKSLKLLHCLFPYIPFGELRGYSDYEVWLALQVVKYDSECSADSRLTASYYMDHLRYPMEEAQ